MTRKLSYHELRQWGESLSGGQNWDGITAEMVYRMMIDTAGNDYDADVADWDFDEADAKRLLEIMRT